MLKISPVHLFLSSVSWFLTIPFLSCLKWELIFTVPSHRLGRKGLHAWNFCNFFQNLDIVASQYSFSTWIFEGRKKCYRTGTEHQAGSTLGYCIFFFEGSVSSGGNSQGRRAASTVCLLVLEGLLQRWGLAVVHRGDKDTGSRSCGKYSLCCCFLYTRLI